MKTVRAYRKKYGRHSAPAENTIRSLAKNFFEYGSIATRQRPIRPRPKRSGEIIEAVKDSVADNPNVSYRRRSQELNVSGTTLRRILKQDLHLFPYKVQITQRLLPTDKPRRLEYGNAVARMIDAEPDFWDKILMTDEAHFTLSGGVNKQNCRIWGTENPHVIHETPLHDQKITVWAGVCSKTIIGPFFSKLEKPSTAHVIVGCWRTLCVRKCVKKASLTFIFNKTAHLATPQLLRCSFCSASSRDTLCRKMVIWSGRLVLQI